MEKGRASTEHELPLSTAVERGLGVRAVLLKLLSLAYDRFIVFPLCSKNGSIIPLADAVMPVTNIELLYGFGVYENIRAVRGTALFIEEHSERLIRSARVIGLQHFFEEKKIEAWVQALLQKLEGDALNLKMLLLGAREPNNATLFILPLAPLFPDKRLHTKGAALITVQYERQFPDAKSLSMLGSYLAYRKAKEAGAYDALLVNRDGHITEGTRTNFFVLKGQTIIGAPVSEILAGVTMRHVLDVAMKNGFEVKEGWIRPDDLSSLDGAFLTSTSSKVMPLSKVDEMKLSIPEALRTLMKHFDVFLESNR